MRVMHRFEIRTLSLYMYSICQQCLSPRMHQTSNNRYNPNGYGAYESQRLLADLSHQNGMEKNTAFFIYLHSSYSSIRNYQQQRYAKKHGEFSTCMHTFLVNTIGIISYS